MKPNRLSALDRVFVALDRARQPLHVAYLSLLLPPPGAAAGLADAIHQRLCAYRSPMAPFDARLRAGLSGAAWEREAELDLGYHVRRAQLPPPGRWSDLMQLVSELHAEPLDRARPPWRFFLIEGLADGRLATYAKVHHALVDGVAGTRQWLKSMSADPAVLLPPSWALPSRGGRSAPPPAPAAVLRGAARGLPRLAAELLRDGTPRGPATLINRRVGPERAFGARSYPIARVRDLARRFDATLNDIALALCASAVRRYLVEHDALPDAPLVALVPMSTRRDGSDAGNQIVPLLVNLHTHRADPLERLAGIRASVADGKRRCAELGPAGLFAYALGTAAGGLFNMLLRPRHGRLAFNLVISNVPGPDQTLYWQGCRLDGLYPVSAVADGLGLNISFSSRPGSLDFGIVACADAIPNVQRLLVYLEDALNELEAGADRLAPAQVLRNEDRPRRRARRVRLYARRELVIPKGPAAADVLDAPMPTAPAAVADAAMQDQAGG